MEWKNWNADYGIMVLGVFRRNDKKRAFGFVDKWLDKIGYDVSGRDGRQNIRSGGCKCPELYMESRIGQRM